MKSTSFNEAAAAPIVSGGEIVHPGLTKREHIALLLLCAAIASTQPGSAPDYETETEAAFNGADRFEAACKNLTYNEDLAAALEAAEAKIGELETLLAGQTARADAAELAYDENNDQPPTDAPAAAPEAAAPEAAAETPGETAPANVSDAKAEETGHAPDSPGEAPK